MQKEMLVINASPHGEASRSFRMFRGLIAGASEPRISVTHLGNSGYPGVSADFAKAVLRPSSDETGVLDRSEAHIRDLERTDALVVLTPVHNLTVPASLKCWIDHVVRRDRSFRSGPTGKIGLLSDRPTMVVVTSGGFHVGTRMNQKDFLSPYLTEILAIIGIRTVEFVHLQGTVVDAAAIETTERDAEAKIKAWFAALEVV